MARAADLIGDRWTLLIIREALYGVTRFDAMHADLGAPRTVLSGRLRKLCAAGIMTKRPYKKPGQRLRHQYVLTSKGVELALPLIALMQWGDKHLRSGAPLAEIVERKSGSPCRVGLINDAGAPVEIGQTQFRLKS
ncbi:MAG: helix-turn-helix transcriptional regulator [Alphaproteobacteria bacterium]|nr:helix-turn-helix transcriptional regulator [Alphaproteobacteria bacterium]